ncbi:Presequence protease, mitochondrial [Neochlamydia sp. EPS4]|uniref:insulinase family protein n=1 Tax=Neochlamydia sp. EPS4 TaxID=1478175 RepID=UPI000582D62A|nr:insulinase family protein [Neochlamydia sp. EPS4]KIC76387.1 Presequence protease, mitochondrial [Neochlamydia sp. EPS4]
MAKKTPSLRRVTDKYLDFTVTKALEIPELQCILTELIHTPTGAQVMHLGNEDPENLFCLSFQTLPNSSNGVAHILEHTVLCGSEKFPVKDPFFAMTHRSLNTYMNALTGQDFTCYPAASQVPKDFYNLLEVYLDAVFKPNLKYFSFLQEGHRLEFSNPTDPHSPLEYKGIVFNEMKGAMASPMSRLGEALNQAMYPNTIYGYNSGGDPKIIPSLSYNELVEFHQKYYHPSRCLFFFYGNLPLVEHLDFITQHTLRWANKASPLPPIPFQPRFSIPHYVHEFYPIASHEPTENKTMLALGWLTCHILEQHELLALSIIEIILMDTDASPLKMALLKSGLCKTASAYIDTDIHEAPFIIILKGCKPESAGPIENLIRSTLIKITKEGISLNLIENAMHQLEFFRSEITGDQSPFGLSLFMRAALLKQHGAKPEEGLMIHTLFDRLRQHLTDNPRYLTNLIHKYFIDNPHYVRLILEPSKELESQELEQERAALNKIHQSLSVKEIEHLLQQAKELTAFQKAQEEACLDILPKLSLEDIPVHGKDYLLNQERIGNFQVFTHSCFTNRIIYADLVFNLPNMEETDLFYARLFTLLLPQMGCGGRNYMENLEFIQAHLGGINGFLSLNIQAHDFNKISPTLSLKGKALYRKAPQLFQLLHEMATSTDFKDLPRVKEILQKHYTTLESSINQNSLRYATNLSAAGLSIPSHISNHWYGLEYFWKIKELALNFELHKEILIAKLIEMKDKLLATDNPHLVLSCDAKIYEEIKAQNFYGLLEMPLHSYEPWKGDFILSPVVSQGRTISAPVAFISKVFNTVPYIHEYAPALSIAAFLFDNLTLHPSIREQGGAYGGGAVSNAMSGNFYFYSYRDPHIFSTLNAFEASINHILQGEFDDEDVVEAKLEMIQAMDAPVSPGSRADLAYSWLREGKTAAVRQTFRTKLLALTKQEIIETVRTFIAPNWQKGATIAFAGKELLEKENALLAEHHRSLLQIETI